MISNEGLNITVVRKTIPSLKRTVIKDWIDILKGLDIWKEDDYNATDRIWNYYDSSIQFISTDDAEKLRGIKSDILFIDEASEIVIAKVLKNGYKIKTKSLILFL